MAEHSSTGHMVDFWVHPMSGELVISNGEATLFMHGATMRFRAVDISSEVRSRCTRMDGELVLDALQRYINENA